MCFRIFLLGTLIVTCSRLALGQCLTDFTKLLPEPSVDASSDFGRSVSLYGDYAAIGLPLSDSLGRGVGLVYIYQRTANEWRRIAIKSPQSPIDGLQFGQSVKLSQNYLLVTSAGFGGQVHVFKKSASGWDSGAEIITLSHPATTLFGVALGYDPVAISEDEQTFAIADAFYRYADKPQRTGAIFIYHRAAAEEWSSNPTPTLLESPEDDAQDFGRSGVAISENRILAGTPIAPTAGAIYVFKDTGPGTFENMILEARLEAGPEAVSMCLSNFAVIEKGLFTKIGRSVDGGEVQIGFFPRLVGGGWASGGPACFFDQDEAPNTSVRTQLFPLATDGINLYSSSLDSSNNFNVFKISPGTGGNFCNPNFELIDSIVVDPSEAGFLLGRVLVSNQSGTTMIGFMPDPNNGSRYIAFKAYTESMSGWESSVISNTRRSTGGHFFGRTIFGLKDFLFVGAPFDATVRTDAGAVYTYQKQGNSWRQTGKLLAPVNDMYDRAYGTAVAANDQFLAVGAAGFDEKGRVFMYRKDGPGWENPILTQIIKIPEDTLIVYAYGDHLDMNEEWLVVPYVQNSPARIFVALFRFDGSSWNFYQAVDIGMANFFAKESTLDVDIEGNVIVAGPSILILGPNGRWRSEHSLLQTDPEPFQVLPGFTGIVSNGDFFGYSVALHDSTIFISAPTKDHDGLWDVGAVYVYTKGAQESWSTRTETAKIIPRVVEERALFGVSIDALFNTIIIGAPGGDYYRDGRVRNEPGRAYVYQSRDFEWQQVDHLVDFTGDSFIKDYYGAAVGLDASDFFMGAPIEDLPSGRVSGSVYVTPIPPIIKLVPPICLNAPEFDLFGYPFGGVWSGPGITNSTRGTFNPALAGLGTHEITYITPSCSNPGRLRIRVARPPVVEIVGEATKFVCESINFSIWLEVNVVPAARYTWYFRSGSQQPFAIIPGNSNKLLVDKRGEYQVAVTVLQCTVFSPVFSIVDEVIPITTSPAPKTCTNQPVIVPLTATPTGGNWIGLGASGSSFNSFGLGAGGYPLTYRLTSENGCVHQKVLVAQVVSAFVPTIQKEGNLCDGGDVKLTVTGTPPPSASFSWSVNGNGTSFIPVGADEKNLAIQSNGEYKVKIIHDQVCETEGSILVRDQFTASLQPVPNEVRLCSGELFELEASPIPSATYQWLFSPEESQTPVPLSATSARLRVDKAGLYSVRIEKGYCAWESQLKRIDISPPDSLFVPNVFTPNGDGKNDLFFGTSSDANAQLVVFNRSGVELYNGYARQGWNGGDAPSGVYFWRLTYFSCTEEPKDAKGTVTLVR